MADVLFKGIDVSSHNGQLDHVKIKNSGIDFAIVRAGYGKGSIDSQFKRNMDGFLAAGVRAGAYWFVYAKSVEEAVLEANYFAKALEPYKGKVSFPVACDFEYDSEENMKKSGITPTKRLNTDIVKAFCGRMTELGWYTVNYTNIDFLNNHFNAGELQGYDVWCAQWGVSKPSVDCSIWQYSSAGIVPGSSASTDMNYAYKDYPSIIKEMKFNGYDGGNENTGNENVTPESTTLELAVKVMNGEFGAGAERKEKLGLRYEEVQDFVNHIYMADVSTLVDEVYAGKYGSGNVRKAALGARYDEVQDAINNGLSKKTPAQIAEEIWTGKCSDSRWDTWGNGKTRKERLIAAGYDYNAVQRALKKYY